jgi:hypothetical protein
MTAEERFYTNKLKKVCKHLHVEKSIIWELYYVYNWTTIIGRGKTPAEALKDAWNNKRSA